jgi:hypothetical protein
MSNTEYPTLSTNRPHRPKPMKTGDEILRSAMRELPPSSTIVELKRHIEYLRQSEYSRFDREAIALNGWVDNATEELEHLLKRIPSGDIASLVAAHGSPRLLASLVACAGTVSAK